MLLPRYRGVLALWLALTLGLTAASSLQAAPRVLARHRGLTTINLSGNLSLTLSRGCYQLPVGQGRPWQVGVERARRDRGGALEDPRIASRAEATLQIRDGRVTLQEGGLRSHLHGVTVDNPLEVMRGLAHGAPGRGLGAALGQALRGVVDGPLAYAPRTFSVEHVGGGAEPVRVGLDGALKVRPGLETAHRWSERYGLDATKRWVTRTFQGSGDSRAQLLTLLSRIAPAERTLIAGLVETQLDATAEARAALRAGRHTLQAGGGGCQIQIQEGTEARLRLDLKGSTGAGTARIATLGATVGLSRPVRVEGPLTALHALRHGGRSTGLGRAVRRTLDRLVTVSVEGLELQRAGSERASRVRLTGTLKLFNTLRLRLDRSVRVADRALAGSGGAAALGLLDSAQGRLDLTLRPAGGGAGAGAGALVLSATPTLRARGQTLELDAPVQLRTPAAAGDFTIRATHQR